VDAQPPRERYARNSVTSATVPGYTSSTDVVVEDACQFASSRLVYHANRVKQETALALLAKTATRDAAKPARRDQRQLSLEAQLEQTGQLNMAATTPPTHEQAEWREQLARVRQLSARRQRFAWLQAAGLSYDEIASRQLDYPHG
jgi:hypothetical protein